MIFLSYFHKGKSEKEEVFILKKVNLENGKFNLDSIILCNAR